MISCPTDVEVVFLHGKCIEWFLNDRQGQIHTRSRNQLRFQLKGLISEFILSFLMLAGFASSGKLNCFDDLNSLGIVWDGGPPLVGAESS